MVIITNYLNILIIVDWFVKRLFTAFIFKLSDTSRKEDETPMKDAFNAFNDESLLECSQKTEISEIEAEKHFNGTILFYLYSLFSHFYYGFFIWSF